MLRARRSFLVFALGLAAIALPCAQAPAQQSWPTRNVSFIVTLGPGSGTDIGGRLLADRLTKKWGQPVVIENKPGGDGIVAINAFVGAKDDHILLLSPTSSFIAHPYLHDNLPYKPEDLAPIARMSNTFVGISVPVALPANSLSELVAVIRSKPGELNWAGVTGAHDFIFEGWLKATGLDMKKVPYRNPVEAANDLAENRVQVYQSAVAIAQPQIEAGKIKLLAVINSVRPPAFPNVPTVAEVGHPGAHHRRAGRTVRAADHAAGVARADRGRREGGHGGRSDHQGPADRHRPIVQSGRAGRVRRLDRGAARHRRQRRQGSRHPAKTLAETRNGGGPFRRPAAPRISGARCGVRCRSCATTTGCRES